MTPNKKRILGITLARAGSKGVAKKNMRLLLGKPLLDYTLDLLPEIVGLDEFIVSTDSPEIRDHARSKDISVPFLRPIELSTDYASSVSALKHAVFFMENKLGVEYSHVVELMTTNPLKTAYDVNFCIDKLLSENLDSVIAVHRVLDHHPARIKKIENDRLVDFCVAETPESRRQDLVPHAYIRSGAIYAMSRNLVVEDELRYGTAKSAPYILPENRAINIDTELDFQLAEIIMKARNIE